MTKTLLIMWCMSGIMQPHNMGIFMSQQNLFNQPGFTGMSEGCSNDDFCTSHSGDIKKTSLRDTLRI